MPHQLLGDGGADAGVRKEAGVAPPEVVEPELPDFGGHVEVVGSVLRADAGPVGHIFNLGHGTAPPTDPESAKHLVETVHRLGCHVTAPASP